MTHCLQPNIGLRMLFLCLAICPHREGGVIVPHTVPPGWFAFLLKGLHKFKKGYQNKDTLTAGTIDYCIIR